MLLVTVFVACDKDDDDSNNNTPPPVDTTTVNSVDIEFTRLAAMNNYSAIAFGHIAADSSAEPTIIDYGNLMKADYSVAYTSLHTIATDLSLFAPDSLDSAHVAIRTELLSLNGYLFDSLYIHTMVSDHQIALNLYQSEVSSGNNYRLKSYASNMIPKIQMHLAKADSIADSY